MRLVNAEPEDKVLAYFSKSAGCYTHEPFLKLPERAEVKTKASLGQNCRWGKCPVVRYSHSPSAYHMIKAPSPGPTKEFMIGNTDHDQKRSEGAKDAPHEL